VGLRDLIIKKFVDRVSDVSKEAPDDKKDIIHLVRREAALPKKGEKAVLPPEWADDLTLTDEEIRDLTGKKSLRYTRHGESALPPGVPVEDLTLTEEELTDIVGKKSVRPDNIISLENLPDEDLTLTNEEISDLIGKKTDGPRRSDESVFPVTLPDEDLTLTNEEIRDIIGEKRVQTGKDAALPNSPNNDLTLNNDPTEDSPPENIDQVAVLTDFLDEPTFNGSNVIDLLEKKSGIPESGDKISVSEADDEDESDKGEIIDLTGKEADPEDTDEAIIDLTGKETPEEFADNGMFLQAESVSSEVVDYEAMILKDFLDDTFIEDEQAIHLIEEDTSESSSDASKEEIIELMELAVDIPDDDNILLTEKKEEKSSPERESVIDLKDIAASIPDDDEHTINIVKENKVSVQPPENTGEDIAIEVFDDDEDTIFPPVKHFSSEHIEEIIDIADVAVEVSEDDEDTINLTGKEILSGYDIQSLFPSSYREETESFNGLQGSDTLTVQKKKEYSHPETDSEVPADRDSAEPADDGFLSFQDIQDIERMMAGDSDGLFSDPEEEETGRERLFAPVPDSEAHAEVCNRLELNELSQEEKDLLEWLETDSDQKKDDSQDAGHRIKQENASDESRHLFSEADAQEKKARDPRRTAENKLRDSQKEPSYIKTLEQFVTKKLSEKIEHIEIDEQMIEKVLSEKIEGIVADMIEKAIAKERTRLMKYAGRKTTRG
jgi:hypothetical protein